MGRIGRKAGLALASAGFDLLNRGRLQRQISFFSVIDRSTVRRKTAF
jgi:hypothetical protein